MTSRRTSPAPHDDIRVGDTERDAVAVALHEHFAEGRLDRGELDGRLDAALAAKTHGDLRTIVRDLPGPSALPEPAATRGMSGQHHHHRHHPAWGRGPRFPVFPLMLVVFLGLTFTVGPGPGLLAVLNIALVIWIARTVLLAVGIRPR